MVDANVRRPVATRFEHGVDFGLLVHKSPFMADDRDPLVLSNYIFELLEVNPGVAGFLIQLHPDDVDAVVESVTDHAEKGAGTKTTLYVGQEEEEVEEVEEEEEDAGGVGAGGRKKKPHNPLMISDAQTDAQAADAAGGAAAAAGARPAKPVAARLELEGEKRLPEGASWRFGEPGDEACRMGGTGWYRQVTITEKEGGVERKTNLTLPSYVWVWGGKRPSGRKPQRGKRLRLFCVCLG